MGIVGEGADGNLRMSMPARAAAQNTDMTGIKLSGLIQRAKAVTAAEKVAVDLSFAG